MSHSPTPHAPPPGQAPLHTVQVLGGGCSALGGLRQRTEPAEHGDRAEHGAGGEFGEGSEYAARVGTAAHVRSLTAGLVARGVRVTVSAPEEAELRHGFTSAGAHFAPAPAHGEHHAITALRAICAGADLVHAHGLRAGMLAALALGGRGERPPLVVTWHTRDRTGTACAPFSRLLEWRVARTAAVVLGATSDLVESARRYGARDARLARLALPAPPDAPAPAEEPEASPAGDDPVSGTNEATPAPGGRLSRLEWGSEPAAEGAPPAAAESLTGYPADSDRDARAAEAGVPWPETEEPGAWARRVTGARDRPLLLSMGRLDRHHGYGTVLTAARAWRGLTPRPLLAIVGDGAQRPDLQRRIDEEALPVLLLGHREDAFQLLAGADIALLSARWEARSPLAQEALRAGVPLVATAVGGVPELVGEGALLVPYGDPDSLAQAVIGLLRSPERGARLARRGLLTAASWPSEEDTVAHVLSVYDELVPLR